MSDARPRPASRAFVYVFAFSVAWLAIARGAAADPALTGAASRTDAVFTSTSACPADVIVLDVPLVPEAFGPVALPMSDTVPSLGSRARAARTPRGLLPLFVSYAVLQTLDVHSTLRVMDRGGVEQNTVLAPLVNRPAAFIAFKAGVTAATLLAANRLSKHHRVPSYVLMFALNSAYAVIVAHNYRLGDQLR